MKSLRTDKKALQYWDLVCHPPIIRDFPKNLPVYLRVGALIRWDDLDDSFGKLYESDSEWFVLKPIDNHIKLYNDQYGLFEREATTEEMLLLERENVKENGKSKQIDLRVFFRNTVSQKK
jgi:hypothetical protein